MKSKTPKFDKNLEKYFFELKLDEKGGQERSCKVSGEEFYIRKEDIDFYKKIKVPLPTLSPNERMRRKMGFSNVSNMFFVESSLTGKKIVATYPKDTPYKIYEYKNWLDKDFTNLAGEYDSEKKFFEQYKDFQLTIPRPNLDTQNVVNSAFGSAVSNIKNCYLISDARDSEDSAYSNYIEKVKNTYQSFGIINTDICYDSSMINDSYKIFFSEFSSNCMNSSFLFDCKSCNDCFMCTNLRHKNYCFENKQLSKEKYQEKIKEINLGDRNEIIKLKDKFKKFKEKAIHRANHNEKNINCTGDYINNSKNCHSSFYIIECDNCNYSTGAYKHRDVYDMFGGFNAELSYESISYLGDNVYNVKFSGKVDNVRDSEYCDLCKNCNNCFACIGLKNKEFCIFNKQYSDEEYWQKIDEIKTKMLKSKEYGEFFPPKLSPIPYNISFGSSYGGYNNLDLAKKYGYKIKNIPENINKTGKEIHIEKTLADIKDISGSILEIVLIDKNTKKFKYTKKELEFHRKHKLALPAEHYSTILANKRIALGPIDFSSKFRECFSCGKKTQATFPKNHPDAPEKIYCEKCYQKIIV